MTSNICSVSYLHTKKESLDKWDRFWVMSPLGTQLSHPGKKHQKTHFHITEGEIAGFVVKGIP